MAKPGRLRAALGVCAIWLLGAMTPRDASAASAVDHSSWDALLKRSVTQGRVDYRGLRQDPGTLTQYLSRLSGVNPDELPSPQARLVFWINAYNACVFNGVLEHYPLASVKDVKGFFDGIRYRVGGESLTLNQIEAKARALKDWRVHFALVCASSSCPFLRGEAYDADRLDAQLRDQVTRFLADPTRGLRVDGRVLWVSKIFKWYTKDLIPSGSLAVGTLLPVIEPYLSTQTAQTIRGGARELKLLEYDWTLNDQHSGGPS